MPRESHIHKTWLSDDPFRDWIKKDDKNASCKYCQEDINITNGEAALKLHTAGKMHKVSSRVTIGGIKIHAAESIAKRIRKSQV